MSIWSRIKSGARSIWNGTKSIVRQVGNIILEGWGRIIGVLDLFLGFLGLGKKKLRLHIFVLSDENGVSLLDLQDTSGDPLFTEAELIQSIDFLRQTLESHLNVELRPYSNGFIEVIKEKCPTAALDVRCRKAWLDEIGEAGSFFAKHLAGWNAIPITMTAPITAFVVRDVKDKIGCSLGPLTNYITIDPLGVKSESTLAHEVAHSCALFHPGNGGINYLMYPDAPRGNNLRWWQKNLFRSSRHILYW